MSNFLNDKIKGIKPYVPGEQPRGQKYIKLNTNESPFPPSKNAIKLANKELKKCNLYSDPDAKAITKAIASDLGVLESEVIVTNGSDEVLNFAFMAYCDDKTPAIFPDITYGFYKVFASVNGVPKKEIPLLDDFTVDVNSFEKENGVIFIANPNAPTGKTITLEDIERLLRANENRIVVIDEAYVDFGGETAIPLIKKYKNLLVTRTFSKSRSMAGARLGFGVASPEIISDLQSIKYSTNPYNVNRITQAMGVGSILDKNYFAKNVKTIIENRAYLEKELALLGFTHTSSSANFVFAKHEKLPGKALYLTLKEKGILVRHFESERISGYVRITVGSLKEVKALISAIKTILE